MSDRICNNELRKKNIYNIYIDIVYQKVNNSINFLWGISPLMIHAIYQLDCNACLVGYNCHNVQLKDNIWITKIVNFFHLLENLLNNCSKKFIITNLYSRCFSFFLITKLKYMYSFMIIYLYSASLDLLI